MNYIICRMLDDRLPEQWAGVMIRVCDGIEEYNIEGDRAFKMIRATEECYNILKSEYQEPVYEVRIDGRNVIITDVRS